MDELAHELQFRRKWWWDPIDMGIFQKLDERLQREVLAVSLDTQSAVLKAQAAGLDKMSGALRGKG